MTVWIAITADAAFGDPPGWHPVIGIGKIIAFWENRLYDSNQQVLRGFAFAIAVMLTCSLGALIVHKALFLLPFGWAIESVFCGWFLAAKSLSQIADRMKKRFEQEGLIGGRKLIGEFVSRDVDALSEEEILRATAETMAENIIDGVLAPLLFLFMGLVCGSPLVGIVLYKAINTMDSMVGYRNAQYHAFGRAAAKIDDWANWIPARIGVFAILAAGLVNGGSLQDGWKVMRRDRKCHSSPNSAYAEAAIAGLYRCRLGGDSQYFGLVHHRPWIGGEYTNPTWATLRKIKTNIWISEIIFVLLLIGGWNLWV